ncbi:MAG TPA: F0F1 ATP synthase subunit alpha, partial [Bacteroidales bacterium]|nr:F0F1 ATP synthase subunit alpha [Bacteroidales bacterium]
VDQAQFRELEAFSKFGSDLDAATMAVLDKGRRNVEILKQGQYSPVPVQHQVAIIYCGTKGALQHVPIHKVREFEKDYIEYLELKHKDTLQKIAEGVFNDEITNVLDAATKEVSAKYK